MQKRQLAMFLIALVAKIAIQHTVTHQLFAYTIRVGLLAQKILRVNAILAAFALELSAIVVQFDRGPGQHEPAFVF
jgi:hypothetical protein